MESNEKRGSWRENLENQLPKSFPFSSQMPLWKLIESELVFMAYKLQEQISNKINHDEIDAKLAGRRNTFGKAKQETDETEEYR